MYTINISEEKIKPHQITALHLITGVILVAVGGIVSLINLDQRFFGLAQLVTGITILSTTLFRHKTLLIPRNNFTVRLLELMVLLLFIGFSIFLHWQFPAILYLLVAITTGVAIFFEGRNGQGQSVLLTDACVTLPGRVGGRQLQWWEIEQILLRYGTLSIDCLDNKLFQFSLKGGLPDQEDFELYCRAMIAANKHKTPKNNW
jgi:hypothetical protein